ncbi:MAG TPA: cytochrome P450 [Candidatus Limnocylindrales bacterium]|nr:cytochrome P450 [Candidatus Limnocylindrales bacterium]
MSFVDLDLSNPDCFDGGFPHEFFRALRREDPVHWNDTRHEVERNGRGFWNITKYEDVKMMSRNPLLFSSWEGGTNIFELSGDDLHGSRSMMLNMDPPQHVKYRRLVAHNFTPRMIDRLESHIRDLAREIIDNIAERGSCDFIMDVAAQLPMKTIMEIVGVPEEDQQRLFDVTNKLVGFDDPEYQGSFDEGRMAAAEVAMYGQKLADLVSECPMDNLASALYHGKVDGQSLDPLQYNYFFLMLMVAGNETTRTMTAHGMRLLMEHPDQRRKLIEDPSLIPNAVEEFLRYNPPVMYFRRTLTDDFQLRGKLLRKGDKVVMWYPSANRDEDIYADPDRFDVTRNIPEHLGLGIGEHYCLGASFARAQLRSIFTEILTRLPDMQPAGPMRFLRSNFVQGIKEMPVRYTPARRTPAPHASGTVTSELFAMPETNGAAAADVAAPSGCPFHTGPSGQVPA